MKRLATFLSAAGRLSVCRIFQRLVLARRACGRDYRKHIIPPLLSAVKGILQVLSKSARKAIFPLEICVKFA